MLIRNTVGWKTPWLRKLIRWLAGELEYDWRRITAAHFCLAHRLSYKGWAYCESHALRVKLNPLNRYPLTSRVPRTLPPVTYADPLEVLVGVTAHEIAHLERWDRFARGLRLQGKRDTLLERDTERLARTVLAAFRCRRDEVLGSWGDAGPGPLSPVVVHQLTCRQCGMVHRSARRLSNARRRSCGVCFKRWKDAAAAGEFLLYERVRGETAKAVEDAAEDA